MCSFTEESIDFLSENHTMQDRHQFFQQNRKLVVYQENGSIYHGRIKQGKKHDLSQEGASLVFEDLHLVYRGQFVSDMKEGFGTISSDPSQIPHELKDVKKEMDEEDAYIKKSIYHFEGTFHKDKKEGDG